MLALLNNFTRLNLFITLFSFIILAILFFLKKIKNKIRLMASKELRRVTLQVLHNGNLWPKSWVLLTGSTVLKLLFENTVHMNASKIVTMAS